MLLLWTNFGLWAADTPITSAAPNPRGRIVVLGDSITAGYGLDPAQAYPSLLQQKIDTAGLPFVIVNAGVSGDTTASGLRRIEWALGPGADVLIIALGRTKVPALAVIVAGMQMPGNMGREFVEQFSAVFPAVAKENDAVLLPFLIEGVGGIAEFNQADLIHPNAEGQKRVAENVWTVLQKVVKSREAKRK